MAQSTTIKINEDLSFHFEIDGVDIICNLLVKGSNKEYPFADIFIFDENKNYLLQFNKDRFFTQGMLDHFTSALSEVLKNI